MASVNPLVPDMMFSNVPAATAIHQAEYIIDSSVEEEEEKYVLGYDFMQSLNLNSWANRIYDNGHFQIYLNPQEVAH
jgi:hypothetical protein